ncbi:hypothetical protein [Actinomadura litoris]|uniref:hypothetical protein n=1 Tax=Actinomadura litoris TaxID=2678616 RepID=UPI001FA7DB2F|nr:hypothetical protein [Actinomadura litoris]
MSIAIAFLALAFSLGAFVHDRARSRRDLLLNLHERLIAADQQEGRRLLYLMAEERRQVEHLTPDEHAKINNALALLNVLALYYTRRYVRRKDVLELWAARVVRVFTAAQPVLEHRSALSGYRAARHLRALSTDAEAYLQRRRLSVRLPQPPPSGGPHGDPSGS